MAQQKRVEDAVNAVHGYIRRLEMEWKTTLIPASIYDLCFTFYYLQWDAFDEEQKHPQAVIDNENLSMRCEQTGRYATVFGQIRCKHNEIHDWKLRVTAYSAASKHDNAIMIGIVECHRKAIVKNLFITEKSNGFAIYSGLNSCTICSDVWDNLNYCKGTLFHHNNDVIEMRLDMKSDQTQNLLSYKINGEDMGVAYKIDKKEADSDEYCLAITAWKGFGLQLLQYDVTK